MSKYKGPMTAEELMKQLQNDPEYLQIRREKDERSRLRAKQLDELLDPILRKLDNIGFSAASLQDLVRQYAPLSEPVIGVLIDSLGECQDTRVQESLVRSLAAAEHSFDGRVLVDYFESTSNESFRFAILNTIALNRPHSIEKWLKKASQNEYLRQKLSDLGYDWTKP